MRVQGGHVVWASDGRPEGWGMGLEGVARRTVGDLPGTLHGPND